MLLCVVAYIVACCCVLLHVVACCQLLMLLLILSSLFFGVLFVFLQEEGELYDIALGDVINTFIDSLKVPFSLTHFFFFFFDFLINFEFLFFLFVSFFFCYRFMLCMLLGKTKLLLYWLSYTRKKMCKAFLPNARGDFISFLSFLSSYSFYNLPLTFFFFLNSNEMCNGNTINSFLLKPIQRSFFFHIIRFIIIIF